MKRHRNRATPWISYPSYEFAGNDPCPPCLGVRTVSAFLVPSDKTTGHGIEHPGGDLQCANRLRVEPAITGGNPLTRGSRKDVEYVHTILHKGTSADRQLAVFRAARAEGCNEEDALVRVTDQTIAGAGLDVYAREPHAPGTLTALPNVVLSPHIGGHTLESHVAMQDCVIANLEAFFAGNALPYQIKEG